MQQRQMYRPDRLMAAVFAAEFIDTPFNTPVQAEVVTMKCQHFQARDSAVEPVREFHLNPHHATVNRRLLNNSPPLDEPKSFVDTHTPGHNIRGDRHTLQPLKCLLEQLVSPLTGTPVGTDQKIIGGKVDNLLWLPSLLHSL